MAGTSSDEVLETLSDKLVRRHPHVFGDVEAATSSEVLKNWEAIKAGSGRRRRDAASRRARRMTPDGAGARPLLESVSRAMPALLEGMKLSNKAAHVGFDWPSIDGIFEKLDEEAEELRREVERIPAPGPQPVGEAWRAREGARFRRSCRRDCRTRWAICCLRW